MAIMLAPFDASRDFVTQASFRAGGRIWLRKEPFDKSFVNERVLGQLYEQRRIAYAEGRPRRAAPPPAPIRPAIRLGDLLGGFVETIKAHVSKNSTDSTTVDAGTVSEADANEVAAAPAGDAETAATVDERDAKIDQLLIDHSHAQLLEKASDLEGMSKRTPKAEIAAALVDAGRHP